MDASDRSMLTASVNWEHWTGDDTFGNAQFSSAQTIDALITGYQSTQGGNEEDRQQGPTVYSANLLTDAVGADVRDRFTVNGVAMYAQTATTVLDEYGVPYLQKIAVQSIKRG